MVLVHDSTLTIVMTDQRLTIDTLRHMDEARFVAAFGAIFEHSPWVAKGAWEAGPFETLEALHDAMMGVCRAAPRERRLALIRAHPDLAGKAAIAGAMTAESTDEQAGAGLDRLTSGEYVRFRDLNESYKAKFGFPFVLAVKGHDKRSILQAYAERVGNSEEAEFDRAIEEIGKIAWFRLGQAMEDAQ